MSARLGVNIDHIATLREARRINEPDPLEAAFIVKSAGAHQITLHLREDRRHICDSDLESSITHSKLPINVECAADAEITKKIAALNPHKITLVPEKREEITTEGGLNLESSNLHQAIVLFQKEKIPISLFINPNEKDVQKSVELGANEVELHTGHFANIFLMLHSNLASHKNAISDLALPKHKLQDLLHCEINRIKSSAKFAKSLGLVVSAGHGLNVQNLPFLTHINEIEEFNIGHSIISRALFIGLHSAIKEILALLQ